MKLWTRLTLVCAVGLSGTLACSDDETTTTGPGSIGESNRGTVEGVTYGIVMPLIRQLALEDYLSQVNPAAAANSPNACEPLEICSSGTAELCTDPGSVQINFTQCRLAGTEVDGSISLDYGPGAGAGTFALSLTSPSGDVSMTGNIAYSQDSECFGITFTNGTVVVGDLTMGLAGGVSWCNPRSMVGNTQVPSFGSFEITIPSLGQLVDFSIFSDPPGDFQVLLLNLNRTESYHVCHGNVTESSFRDCADI